MLMNVFFHGGVRFERERERESFSTGLSLTGPTHTPEKFENSTITGHFRFVFEENWGRKIINNFFLLGTKTQGQRFQIRPV